MIAPPFQRNPSLKRWLDGIEPVWALLDVASFGALHRPHRPRWQAAGFTLEEIAELLALDPRSDRARARRMARERIAVLDDKIADLQTIRKALNHLANRCARGGSGLCPILMALESACAKPA